MIFVKNMKDLEGLPHNGLVGPIPAGVDPETWLQAAHPNGTHCHYILFKQVKTYREGHGSFAKVRGTFWMAGQELTVEVARRQLTLAPTIARH